MSWINPIDTTNDTEVKGVNVTKPSYATHCAVCSEPVPLDEWEVRHVYFKLCPECIKAIKWARLQMKSCNMNIEDDIK